MECAVFASSSALLAVACYINPRPREEANLHPIATIATQQHSPYWVYILGVVFQGNFQFKGIAYDITVLANLVHLLFLFAKVSFREHLHL